MTWTELTGHWRLLLLVSFIFLVFAYMCFQLTTLSFLVHVKPQYITVVKRYCRIVWAKKETGDVRSRAAGLKLHMVVTARAT